MQYFIWHICHHVVRNAPCNVSFKVIIFSFLKNFAKTEQCKCGLNEQLHVVFTQDYFFQLKLQLYLPQKSNFKQLELKV